MRFPARLLGILIAVFFLFFVSRTSFAQTNSYPLQNIQPAEHLAPNTNLSVPNNLNTYAQSVLFSVMSAVGCQLAGIDPANPNQPCLSTDPKTGKVGLTQNNRGLLGFTVSMITVLYNPPIHTSDYIHYVAGNFGIAKSANAQNYSGVGLTTIAPIASLWIIFRNIVYLLFVIIFVLIGVGIMFRVKIDPRTVMTIQNQIPKIIIGIILVTLSFPIAGFLIDIMWLVILVVISTLVNPNVPGVAAGFNYVTPFGLASAVPGGILGIAGGTAGFLQSSIFNAGFTSSSVNTLVTLPTSPCTDILCFLGGLIGGILGAIFGWILGLVVGLIAFFVVIIALLYALLKLWFELIKAYISILIDIIFAPFWIVAGLIPGSGEKVGFSAWLRDMLGNLMAFPAAIGMFFLAAVFTAQFNDQPTVFFLPPLIGPQSNPGGSSIGVIIAFGIIMMTPNVVKMTKTVFKSGGMGMGPAGGAGFAAAGALGGAIGNRLYGKNPLTGKREGPLINVGQRAVRGVAGTGVGRRVGRMTSPVRNSRVSNWFRSKETIEARRIAREANEELSVDEIRKKIGGS